MFPEYMYKTEGSTSSSGGGEGKSKSSGGGLKGSSDGTDRVGKAHEGDGERSSTTREGCEKLTITDIGS